LREKRREQRDEGLLDYRIVGNRVQNYRITGLKCLRVAGLQDSIMSELQGCRATGLQCENLHFNSILL
jgi:hypothetical protein